MLINIIYSQFTASPTVLASSRLSNGLGHQVLTVDLVPPVPHHEKARSTQYANNKSDSGSNLKAGHKPSLSTRYLSFIIHGKLSQC
jgi:hypothetical protein